MKIAIVAPSAVPFVIGGAEKFWWGLQSAIRRYTHHEAELIKLPTPELKFYDLIESYRRFSELTLDHFDVIISSKYPAWMVSHRHHICYMQHTLRGLYDLYGVSCNAGTFHFQRSSKDKELEDLFLKEPRLEPLARFLFDRPPDRSDLTAFWKWFYRIVDSPDLSPSIYAFPGPFIRAVVHYLDRIALSPQSIAAYFAISKNVARRADYFPENVQARVIHHPTDLEGLAPGNYRYVFTASRLTDLKRVDLLIQAFRQIDHPVEFLIAGTGGEEPRLKKLAEGDPRIRFLGFVNDQKLVELYRDALFVPYAPYDEDYGLITVETMKCAKAVITTHDAGGPVEMIRHEETGLIVEPTVKALASAMDRLLSNPQEAQAMGRRAMESVHYINWENTVCDLLGELPGRNFFVSNGRKPKMVVTTTFHVFPPQSGGQARIANLYRFVARHVDIHLVTLGVENHLLEPFPGMKEWRLRKSDKLFALDRHLETRLGVSAQDIAAILGWRKMPELLETLANLTKDADVVVASHPYLFDAIRETYQGELWYEAHNVEWDMKRAALKGPKAEPYLNEVQRVENACCRESRWVMVCSEDDARRLSELYGLSPDRTILVPNGADSFRIRPIPLFRRKLLRHSLELDKSTTVLFIGSWHPPNIEAIDFLQSLAKKFPYVTFILVGSVCYHNVCTNLPPNILSLGVLDEAQKRLLLQTVDIALNPITSGSGTNLKMLEYAAAALPIITTPHGNRGLPFKDGVHVRVVELSSFEDAILAWIEAPGSASELAQNARMLVCRELDWWKIAEAVIDRMVNR